MDEGIKKKNVLDLQFQKYLIIASTSVILTFTYFIGAGLAVLTGQIRLDDFVAIGVVLVISIGVLSVCVILFFNSLFHLKNIPKVVKQMQ